LKAAGGTSLIDFNPEMPDLKTPDPFSKDISSDMYGWARANYGVDSNGKVWAAD
jgi:hypothetical protein